MYWKPVGEVTVILHGFLPSALDGGRLRPPYPLGNRSDTRCIRVRVDLSAGLNVVTKRKRSVPTGNRTLVKTPVAKLLQRLNYPGSSNTSQRIRSVISIMPFPLTTCLLGSNILLSSRIFPLHVLTSEKEPI